ncbi:hypothetical protein J3R82DRAFT_7972 [Butyriboletus roseoflavus]|nr:hypothetical protein J3R82DRAFT_7972 [Butyriboletus roseoflavus]
MCRPTLRALMKGVRANGELDEADLDDMVNKVREQHDQGYVEQAGNREGCKIQGKGRAEDWDEGASVDSMMMDIDAAGSDFEVQSDEVPPAKEKATTSRKPTAAKRAPAKKAPAKGKGKKVASESEEVIELDDDEDSEDEPAPAPTKRTSRAARIDCQESASEEGDDLEGKSFVTTRNVVVRTFWAYLDLERLRRVQGASWRVRCVASPGSRLGIIHRRLTPRSQVDSDE